MHCAGSVLAESRFPDETSPWALEGTVAHKVGEYNLLQRNTVVSYPKKAEEGVDVDREMLSHVQVYVSACCGMLGPNGRMSVESRLNLDPLEIALGGTGDCVVVNPFSDVNILDLKYGAGVPVDAKENPQLMIYLLAAALKYADYMPEKGTCTIVQPRCFAKPQKVDTWETDLTELKEWGVEVLVPAYKACFADDPPRHAGEWCRFCKARFDCEARDREAMSAAQAAFDVIPVSELGPDRLREIMEKAPLIRGFLSDIAERVAKELEEGTLLSADVGFKRVAGRSSKKWIDEEMAAAALTAVGIEAYEPKLLSPAKALKAIKQEGLDTEITDLISVSRGSLVVPVDDKREELQNMQFEEIKG